MADIISIRKNKTYPSETSCEIHSYKVRAWNLFSKILLFVNIVRV